MVSIVWMTHPEIRTMISSIYILHSILTHKYRITYRKKICTKRQQICSKKINPYSRDPIIPIYNNHASFRLRVTAESIQVVRHRIPYWESGNWISFSNGLKRSRKTRSSRWHAVINAGAGRGGKQRRLIIRVWGEGGWQRVDRGCKSVRRRVEGEDVWVDGRDDPCGSKGRTPSGGEGREEERGWWR